MDALVTMSNLRRVREVLENLPAGMRATYDQMMERIEAQDKHDRQLAERVLTWITYACRPLTILELQHALAVSPDMTDWEPDALDDEMMLISVCAGFVVVDADGIVRLVRKLPRTFWLGIYDNFLLAFCRLQHTGVP